MRVQQFEKSLFCHPFPCRSMSHIDKKRSDMQHSYSSSLRQQEYEILPILCIKSKVNWKRAAKLVTSPSNESRGLPTYRLVWRFCVRCARASVYVLVHACSFLLSAQKYTLIIICDVTYGGHDLKQYKCTFVRTYTDTHL